MGLVQKKRRAGFDPIFVAAALTLILTVQWRQGNLLFVTTPMQTTIEGCDSSVLVRADTVEEQNASPCAQIISNDTTSLIPESLIPVLSPHCSDRPELALTELLPDMPFFHKIVDAVQNYNSSIALLAGRGTTGTRDVAQNWLPPINFTTIHFGKVRGCLNESIQACMNTAATDVVRDTRLAMMGVRDRENVDEKAYQRLRNIQADGLARMLSCGDCGRIVLMDSPFVNIITELYFALGPTTKVILTRRDSRAWATKRQGDHRKSSVGFVCSKWQDTPDPFSYSQCSGSATDLGVTDFSVLRQAYEKYNAYIHSLVPADYLLDINLFTSKKIINGSRFHLGEKTASRRWSGDYRNVMNSFLEYQ